MIHLLYKEWKLAAHPTIPLFWMLSALLLIPNYPYYVTFFYTALAIFFVCLNGRENKDIAFSAMLPVRKRRIVDSRILFALIIEGVQLLLAVPVAFLRQMLPIPGNLVGMDANIAFFGLSLGMLGLFNLIFFSAYFRSPDRVGRAFTLASAGIFLYMICAELLVHIQPFFRDRLDTPDPCFLTEKICTLALGLLVFAALTALALRISRRAFEKLDLNY